MPDISHINYEKYLENNFFIPPPSSGAEGVVGGGVAGRKYWLHSVNNLVPRAVSTTESKGVFNVFPLDLLSLDAKNTTASNLGKTTIPPHPLPHPPHLT